MRPIVAAVHFDLDVNGCVFVSTCRVAGTAYVTLNVDPGRKESGRNLTAYLEPEKAEQLAEQLKEAARGA